MKIKIFCPNTNGKLEFTKEELESILNEAYQDGYRDGQNRYWTYTYPNISLTTTSDKTNINPYRDSITGAITTASNSTDAASSNYVLKADFVDK